MNVNWMDYILIATVLFCVYTDVKTRKIKNYITFPLMAMGLISNIISKGIMDGGLFSLKGILICGILSLVLYVVNGFGMGDVKLLMGIGAFKGLSFTLDTLVFSFFAAVIFSFIISPKRFIMAIKNVWGMVKGILYHCPYKITEKQSAMTVAYAVYILCGLIISYFVGGDWICTQLFAK